MRRTATRARTRWGTLAAASAFAVSIGAVSADARAGIAWGDASLRGDDVRVDVDETGHGVVTHTIAIHVAGKRFRAFQLEGIDAHATPPLDEATTAGLDGPGWPIHIVDGKGEPLDGFVEPAKEPRRLRVHLGHDGIPRGDYVITIRYRVDFVAEHALTRDGAMMRLAWSAPSWPEGFDTGHLTFALPSANAEPHVGIADASFAAPRPIDGAALLEVARVDGRDELVLTRPHVPHHDDTQWLLTFDPKAMPAIASALPNGGAANVPSAPPPRLDRRTLAIALSTGALSALVAFFAMRTRDRKAAAAAASRGLSLRSMLPLRGELRAPIFAALIGVSSTLSLLHRPWLSAALLVIGIALSIVGARGVPPGAQIAGRWLAIPKGSIPRRPRRGAFASLLEMAAMALAIAACLALTRLRLDYACIAAMHACALLSLLVSGRASQLPPELGLDAWPRLEKIASALEKTYRARLKVIGHLPRGGGGGEGSPPSSSGTRALDEVRLRIDASERAASAGVLGVEIGCAIVTGFGRPTLVPEMLVRLRADGEAARAIEARIARATDSATFVVSLGRAGGERVVSIRPALTSPTSLRKWAEWIFATAEGTAKLTEAQPAERAVRRASPRPSTTPAISL